MKHFTVTLELQTLVPLERPVEFAAHLQCLIFNALQSAGVEAVVHPPVITPLDDANQHQGTPAAG